MTNIRGSLADHAAKVSALGFGLTTPALVLVGAITVAATLESVAGYCIGCKLFALLMRVGVVPASVCATCADIGLREHAA